MDIAATPLHPLFAARLVGADLSQPVVEGLARAIERAMDEYAVCVLPDQQLDDEQQIAFARLYGPLEVSPPMQSKSGVRLAGRLVAQSSKASGAFWISNDRTSVDSGAALT